MNWISPSLLATCLFMCMWTNGVHQAISRLTVVAILGTLLCMPAHAAIRPWSTLTHTQQEALAPIAQEWNTFPEKQQKRMLATTKGFQQLTPDKKQLFHKRLVEWSKLTMEQRNRAREKYKAFKKVSPDKREAVKRMVIQSEAAKEQDILYAPEYKDETLSSEAPK